MKINQNKDFKKLSGSQSKAQLDFDLFRLHAPEEDINPVSWICFEGKNLSNIISNLFTEIQNSLNISKSELISRIALLINCSNTCVSYRIYNLNRRFPIIMIETLLDLWKKHLNKNDEQIRNKKMEILVGTEFLKQNHPRAKHTLAVKKLTPTLCKLAGAHAADGTLLKRYFSASILKITQKDKQYALAYVKWIKEVFNFQPCISMEKQYHSVRIYNKVIARYFHLFLDFPYGHKAKIVAIPQIIKSSGFKYKRAFACGVMTFEGSVEMSGVISYGGTSKKLRDELTELFQESNLKVTKRNYKNKVFLFRTPKLNKEEAKKWFSLFAENTGKWWKIKDMITGYIYSVDDLKTAKNILNSIYSSRSTSLIELIDIIKSKLSSQNFDYNVLKKETKIKRTKLTLFRNLLVKMNILMPKKQGAYVNKEVHNKIFRNSGLRGVDIARILKVDRKKVQRWKDRGSSIPVRYFGKLLSLAKINHKDINNSIRKTYYGRDGYYYNHNIKTWKLPYRPWFKEL